MGRHPCKWNQSEELKTLKTFLCLVNEDMEIISVVEFHPNHQLGRHPFRRMPFCFTQCVIKNLTTQQGEAYGHTRIMKKSVKSHGPINGLHRSQGVSTSSAD